MLLKKTKSAPVRVRFRLTPKYFRQIYVILGGLAREFWEAPKYVVFGLILIPHVLLIVCHLSVDPR